MHFDTMKTIKSFDVQCNFIRFSTRDVMDFIPFLNSKEPLTYLEYCIYSHSVNSKLRT